METSLRPHGPASATPQFDVLTTSATELQQMLTQGHLTSVDLVNKYLDQMDGHNSKSMKLNAVITVVERADAVQRAWQMDTERREGTSRRPLHGIPTLVKVPKLKSFNRRAFS